MDQINRWCSRGLSRIVGQGCGRQLSQSVRALHGQADIARCGGPLYDKQYIHVDCRTLGRFSFLIPFWRPASAFSEWRVIRPEPVGE